MADDRARIEEVVGALFRAFDSAEVAGGSLDRLHSLFAPGATITVLAAGVPSVTSVAEFLRPRRELFAGGALRDFREWETEGETLLGRDIACRRSRYAKKGIRDGKPFTGGGTKLFQLVRLEGEWKILGFLWQDDA